MNAPATSLTARRRSTTIEDAITTRHAAVIADYLLAKLGRNHARLTEIRDEAAGIDAEYPGYPSLVAQLDALRSSQAA